MSVRIHAIAKETDKTSKEIIDILAERGYEIKSASSTIDNITAQSLIEELQAVVKDSTHGEDPATDHSAEVPANPAAEKKYPLLNLKRTLSKKERKRKKLPRLMLSRHLYPQILKR